LKVLELKGCLVTIDAMGCQKTIASKILEKEADYLLSVKDNQPILREIAEESLQFGRERGVEELGGSYAQSMEIREGKEIKREAWMVPAPVDLDDLSEWKGIKSMIQV
jgi:predicted transposase YbfD/YdcC